MPSSGSAKSVGAELCIIQVLLSKLGEAQDLLGILHLKILNFVRFLFSPHKRVIARRKSLNITGRYDKIENDLGSRN